MSIKWQDWEFEYKHKSPDWFWALWIIAIGVSVFSVIKEGYLFAILILIMAFTASLQGVRKPKFIDFEIDETGVIIDKAKYPYKNLESFWIKDSQLVIETKNHLMSHLIISLKETDEQEVEKILSEHLPKEEKEEPIFNKMAKYL
ncbi:hypothetical protein A3I18_00810 [Candidatus Campbellbacteria bacterium RIFCSPLOWO2_02_FULL_35_11]|uniref:DUF5673 domain-containing protein n=2 Tax=Candidatus Campbelliibacteriota TaxID=1752727 RepID=A0A1F5EQ73_9BACT|nr:MAG: hypothetical protein A3E89_00050 [Candidatus Campbellbacteria bacterium RIFCSPHIGHO2_12_FULL_35_10]OGD69756.1 MAG: hypothetical protein A3I18_00810 [Candidatus Campbellbacteria bacterium RIFCSPLOWO2_02_FULL_35_11]